ncbi:MAG: DNA polymerase, partial [bacterium]|nr:DNA polymerase [bacterium]
IAATFDMPGPTKRHKAYAGYKAQRVKAPDELYAQMPRVKEMLSVFGIPVYEKQGSEADDVIGTIAKQALRQQAHPKPEVIIVSGDMDALQLVNDQVKVFATRRGLQDVTLFDKKAVQAKFSGLLPSQMADYKGLRGDPSDNIPGVRGVGEKTAITLLLQFNSLENIYKKIEKKDAEGISPKLRTTLLASKEDAFISKELGTIDTNVPIDFKLKDCIWKGYSREAAAEKLKELEFFSLVDKLPAPIHASPASQVPQEQSLEERIKQLEESSVLPLALAELERKLIPILGGMEKAGMKIDRKYFTKLAAEMDEKMRGVEKEVYSMAGQPFNLNSPAQLSLALFQTLGLSSKGVKKTPGGVFSTASDELEKIFDLHPIVSQVIAYRELKKLLSTYALPLLEKADMNDRVHTNFDQFGAATGRMSSSNPNLQNIPLQGVWAKKIRKGFIAEKNHVLLSFDYSQMELRITAALAKEEKMKTFFEKGLDIHTMTAAEVFGIPPGDVSSEMRFRAKALNFGVLYGMGARGFARSSGIPMQEAQDFIDQYFLRFPGILRYMEETKEFARKHGYVETMFGRKRFLPDVNSPTPQIRAAAERMAINMPAQGTAADIMKMAMVRVQEQVLDSNPECRMLLQVHDELLLECRETKAQEFMLPIKKAMEEVVPFDPPLLVDASQGTSWAEL